LTGTRKHDPESLACVSENASRGGQLLFGRAAYELMASFWPRTLRRLDEL
jgi:hypothetical protein